MERKTPGHPRAGERDRIRRALAAVAVSAFVAVAVAVPAARRMNDSTPAGNGSEATTTQPAQATTQPAQATTQPAQATTQPVGSTVPVDILGTTTINEGP